ncbi:MAG: Aldo-keto reductase YhdN [Verrucomicrobiae bacterium]|nr:Aldo-keto reductase YhdN [Verrucomicrobiae bacterium]
MVQRTFGKTGWRVSEIGLGGWQFGGPITLDGKPDGWTGISDAESCAAVQRAVELGLNFFDTSDQYGWGRSEEILGQALKDCRSRVFIASKVGFSQTADGHRVLNEDRGYIITACEASLRRLQTDHLDLYQCHLWRTERWPEFLDAFETLQRAGKIRAYGVSTNDFDMVLRFDDRRALAAVQCNYNMLDRRAERDILPYCRARGIAVIARGVLAMGKLSGNYTITSQFDPDDIRSKWLAPANREEFERHLDAVERLRPVAARAGYTLPQLAVKFALSNVAVSVALIGMKNRAQVEANAGTSLLPPITHDEMIAVRGAVTG